MNIKTFLGTIANSSHEIDRLLFSLMQRDIRLRGPALRQLLRINTPELETRLFALLRAIDENQGREALDNEDDVIFIDGDFIRQVLCWRGRTALPSLLEALHDPTFLVRKIAVYVLIHLNDPEIFPSIFQMLMNDSQLEHYDGYILYPLTELSTLQHLNLLIPTLIQGNTEQRHVAIEAIEHIGPDAVASILPLLTEKDAEVRSIAATLLGALGSPEAIHALTTTLHDPDANVRNQTVKALRQLNTQQITPTLIETANDVNSNIRYEALDTLKSPDSPYLFEMHISLLQDSDPDIRAKAITDLSNEHRASDYIFAALYDSNTDVRVRAATVLCKLRYQPAIEPLIAALTDTKHQMRDAATYCLGEFGDPRAVEPLIAAYSAYQNGNPEPAVAPGFFDSHGTTRDLIIQALGKIGDFRATTTLIAALDDPGYYISSSAVRGLEKWGDPRAIEPLLKRLHKKHDSDVAEPLAATGGSQAIEGLYSVLLESQKYPEYVCNSVAKALRSRQQPAPNALFGKLHNAETLEERCKIAMILGILGDPQAFAPLLTVLNNTQEDPLVRSAAIRALYELDSEQTVESLISILSNDSSPSVRAQAAHILAGSRHITTLTALLNALMDKATIVRVAAVASLRSFDDPLVIPALQAMIAQEITRDDDLEDYLADVKNFRHGIILPDTLPEEYAQYAIDFLQR